MKTLKTRGRPEKPEAEKTVNLSITLPIKLDALIENEMAATSEKKSKVIARAVAKYYGKRPAN